MRNIIYIFGTIIIAITFSSCEKIFMKPNPDTDNISVYDEYWKLVDEKFAMWDNPDKHINKDSLHDVTRAMVSEDISSDSLFLVLGQIAVRLMDGHSFIENQDKDTTLIYAVDRDTVDINIDTTIIKDVYLKDDYKKIGTNLEDDIPGEILYTLLEDGAIGYIRIPSWMHELTDDEVNTMFDYFKDTRGLIVDIRDNGGGDPMMSTKVARHFTDKRIHIGYEHFKIGPGPDDFSRNELYLDPIEGTTYPANKPVMVLTSIWCFSATTTFIYSVLPLDNITFIGSRTGGGSGSTADGLLANGWHWQLSVSEFIGLNGEHFDNGTDPDIEVWVNYDDTSQDEVIERAIEEIKNREQ